MSVSTPTFTSQSQELDRSDGQDDAGPTPCVSMSEVGSISMTRYRSNWSSSCMDEDSIALVSRHLSFGQSAELRRGAHLVDIMRGCGKIFQNSRGSALTYELSHPCDRIRIFISHNWSTTRWDKFFALTMKFNFQFTFAVAVFWLTLCCVGYALQIGLPTVEDNSGETSMEVGMLCRLTTIPICAFCLLFGTQIRGLCRWNGPIIFLDKVCIHQVDRRIQNEGIARLGAFLQSSDRMLLLYSEIYMERLWTVYEVAQFVLTTRPVDEIDVMPIFLPRLVFIALPLIFFFNLGVLASRHLEVRGEFMSVIGVIFASIYLRVMRKWARHKSETQECLSTFQVQRCKVAVEEDRAVVYSKIGDLTKAFGFVEKTADEKECLQAFNQEFRQKMPVAFVKMFGVSSFSYLQNLFLSLLVMGPMSVDTVHAFHTSEDKLELVNDLMEDCFWGFCAIPFALFWLEVMASCKIHLRGIWEALWMVFILVLLGGFVVPLQMVINNLQTTEDGQGSTGLARMVCILGMSLCLTIGSVFSWKYRPEVEEGQAPEDTPPSPKKRPPDLVDDLEIGNVQNATIFEENESCFLASHIPSADNPEESLEKTTSFFGTLLHTEEVGNAAAGNNNGQGNYDSSSTENPSNASSQSSDTSTDCQASHVSVDKNSVNRPNTNSSTSINSDSSNIETGKSAGLGPNATNDVEAIPGEEDFEVDTDICLGLASDNAVISTTV